MTSFKSIVIEFSFNFIEKFFVGSMTFVRFHDSLINVKDNRSVIKSINKKKN